MALCCERRDSEGCGFPAGTIHDVQRWTHGASAGPHAQNCKGSGTGPVLCEGTVAAPSIRFLWTGGEAGTASNRRQGSLWWQRSGGQWIPCNVHYQWQVQSDKRSTHSGVGNCVDGLCRLRAEDLGRSCSGFISRNVFSMGRLAPLYVFFQ